MAWVLGPGYFEPRDKSYPEVVKLDKCKDCFCSLCICDDIDDFLVSYEE